MNRELNTKRANNHYYRDTLKNDAQNEWEKAKETGNEIWQGAKDEFNKGEQEVKRDFEELRR